MIEDGVIYKPNNVITARYKLSINGMRLLNLVFTKITPADYLFNSDDLSIEVTTAEWEKWFDLKASTTALKIGIQDLYSASFVFEKDPETEHKMLSSYEYNDGWLELKLNSDFLTACIQQ